MYIHTYYDMIKTYSSSRDAGPSRLEPGPAPTPPVLGAGAARSSARRRAPRYDYYYYYYYHYCCCYNYYYC